MTAPGVQAGAPEYGLLADGKPAWYTHQDYAKQTRERDALVELLAEAQEEMRLIRLKDSNAVYDPTLRIRIAAALAAARGNEVEHG